jgi:hypothetical protein
MERTKLHETKNIGMSLKGKRIVILGFSPDSVLQRPEQLAGGRCGHRRVQQEGKG